MKSQSPSDLIDKIYKRFITFEKALISNLPEPTQEVFDFFKPFFIPRFETLNYCDQELKVLNFCCPVLTNYDFEINLNSKVVVDFSNISFSQIVSNLIYILQTKLFLRKNQNYKTIFIGKIQDINNENKEKIVDPLFMKIKIRSQDSDYYYNFSLDNDGQISQPGNDVIRRAEYDDYIEVEKPKSKFNPPPQWFENIGNGTITKDRILFKLMLANEVARRKVFDIKNDDNHLAFMEKEDFYFDLPVWCAIALFQKLLHDNKIKVDEVYQSNKRGQIQPYYFFGDQKIKQNGNTISNRQSRKQAILYIIQKYVQSYRSVLNFDGSGLLEAMCEEVQKSIKQMDLGEQLY